MIIIITMKIIGKAGDFFVKNLLNVLIDYGIITTNI